MTPPLIGSRWSRSEGRQSIALSSLHRAHALLLGRTHGWVTRYPPSASESSKYRGGDEIGQSLITNGLQVQITGEERNIKS